jgi:hypothetical protein
VFKWDEDWHDGYEPPRKFEWKHVAEEYRIEIGLSLLLSVALLVWWGVA